MLNVVVSLLLQLLQQCLWLQESALIIWCETNDANFYPVALQAFGLQMSFLCFLLMACLDDLWLLLSYSHLTALSGGMRNQVMASLWLDEFYFV